MIALVALGLVLPLSALDGFEVFGTIVFVLLAVGVSSLLGRVLEIVEPPRVLAQARAPS